MTPMTQRTTWPHRLLIGLTLALTMAACGGGDAGDPATEDEPTDTATAEATPTTDATEAEEATEPAAEPTDAAEGDAGPYEVAFLNASSANTFLQSSLEAMTEVGDANDVTITEFDAEFTPGVQATQIQDVIVAGTYDGIIIAALDGAAVIPDLEEAMAAGLEVVILNQVVGEELDTADPQFDGVAASVMAPPQRSGERMGELTLQACADLSPCNVVYFYGIQGIPLDNALKLGFDEVTGSNPDIEVVAEAEGQYLGPDVSLAAMQDVLQRTDEIDVVIGSDQSIQGVQLALQDAGVEDVALIGLGGSEPAIAGVGDGSWFGTVFAAPADEGQFAMQAMVDVLADGTTTGGIDPLLELPDEGLVTADNVEEYEAQWAG